jgi:hypothetical protein
MNIVKDLIARIEETRLTNKTPCKSYATEAAAEKVAQQLAQEVAQYFFRETRQGDQAQPMRYIVAFNEAWGRWVVGFDMTELMGRQSFSGGYLMVLAQKGFYTF